MTQTDQPELRAPSPSTAARLAWSLLILATLYLCYFHNLGAIGLVGPDEPRYAWIARDMAETGDWVTPRLYGKPWFEKPVLYYWGAALSFKLFGVSEAAARLPSALSALFATLALAWLALRLYGAETARWLLLLLPTTVGMIGFSHAAATDMPFSAMLTIAMVFAAVILGLTRNENTPVLSRTPWLALVFFGFFLGLAVLAKGPAAIILSGGAVLLWALFTKRWRDAFRCLHPVAIASFLLTALPWYFLCARRNPDFFRVFIIEHNFKRFLTPEFQHIQPFWFYIPVLLVCFLPWVLVLAWTAYESAKNVLLSLFKDHSFLFVVSWGLFCFIFFSVSKSKLPGYILPAVPAVGLLMSRRIHTRPEYPKRLGILFGSFAALLVVTAELIGRVHFPEDIHEMPRMMATSLLAEMLLIIGGANFFLALGYFTWKSVLSRYVCHAAALLTILGILLVWPLHMSKYERGFISPKNLAEGLQNQGIPGNRIFVWKHANRSWRYGTSFYLHSEVLEWNPENRVEAFVLTGNITCPQITTEGYTWKWLQIEHQGGKWFICQMTPVLSADGPSASSALGGDGNFDDRTDRQPR